MRINPQRTREESRTESEDRRSRHRRKSVITEFSQDDARENRRRGHASRSRTDAALSPKVPQVRRQVGAGREGAAGLLLSLSQPTGPTAPGEQGLWRTGGIRVLSSTYPREGWRRLCWPRWSSRGPGPIGSSLLYRWYRRSREFWKTTLAANFALYVYFLCGI